MNIGAIDKFLFPLAPVFNLKICIITARFRSMNGFSFSDKAGIIAMIAIKTKYC